MEIDEPEGDKEHECNPGKQHESDIGKRKHNIIYCLFLSGIQ